MANGTFGGGNGSTTAPYLVEDAEDFIAVRNRLNAHYRQTQDIDFEGVEFSSFSGFSGSYEGNSFKIKNITMNANGSSTTAYTYQLGLFGTILSPSVVQNVHVENAKFTFNNPSTFNHTIYMGGFAGRVMSGYTTGTSPISNCSFQGVITTTGTSSGTRYLGGIVGYYYDNVILAVRNCTANVDMVVPSGSSYINGITRGMDCYNCHFTGNIKSNNDAIGISDRNTYDCSISNSTIESVGEWTSVYGFTSNNYIVQRCSLTNSTLKGRYYVVGIGGHTISNCSVVDSTIISSSTEVDSLAVGVSVSAYPKITGCLVKNTNITGGVAAGLSALYNSQHGPTVTDCAVIGGTIESKHSSGYAAGMVMNRYTDGSPTLDRCYCSANVIGKGTYLAGILNTYGTRSSVKNSFYLGEYIKGLGARTSSVGFISNVPLSNNANNYTLDTSQMILE